MMELASGTDVGNLGASVMDENLSRGHLLQCFEAQKLSRFPMLPASDSLSARLRSIQPKAAATFLLDVETLELQALA
jgi:hypothetical protein